MFTMKYYDRINELRAKDLNISADDTYDYGVLKSSGFVAALTVWVLDHSYLWMKFLRAWYPILQIGKIVFVSRNKDVKEVLERQDVFETPFGPDMVDTSGGVEAVLGMQDGPAYRQTKNMLAKAFTAADIDNILKPLSWKLASDAVANGNGRLNAVRDLITAVPVWISREYYGFDIHLDEERDFAEWSIALSTMYFADFFGDEDLRRQTLIASAKLVRITDRSIEVARNSKSKKITPLSRLLKLQIQTPEKISDADIRGAMISMVAGFVPTNTMAASHMLDVLFSKPEAFKLAVSAANEDRDADLQACLFEAMRFKPLNPGPMRFANVDVVVAEGKKHAKSIKKGATLIASTQSAMMDDRVLRDPRKFDPERPYSAYMLYGHGMHWCIGAQIANTQITQTLKALLQKPNLRRAPGKAGKLVKWGAFPDSLMVEYDAS
jgi:cytochrome P450